MTFGVPRSNPTEYARQDFDLIPTVSYPRAPLSTDVNFQINTIWRVGLNPSTGLIGDEWIMVNKTGTQGSQVATWRQFSFGGGGGDVDSISGDDSQTVIANSGNIGFTGVTVASATNAKPVFFKKNATSVEELDVQVATAAASSVLNNAGLASFDSSSFNVDSNGWVTFLGTIAGTKITSYTTSGFFTPTANTKLIGIYAIGGGGGGGSGYRGAASTNRSGGGGGGAGAASFILINPAYVSASTTVTIGQGGSGGAAVTTDSTAGIPGSPGTETKFGSRTFATFGVWGQGGGAGNGGGAGGIGITILGPSNINANGLGLAGGSGSTGTGNNPPYYSFFAPNGGAGGGGVDSSNTASNGGTYAQVLYGLAPSNTEYDLAYGGSAGTAPGGVGGNGGNSSNTLLFGTGGAGGGGGAGNNAGAGGAGGNGGYFGGGGGGGGASVNGSLSGAGGNGGNGFLMVIEWL